MLDREPIQGSTQEEPQKVSRYDQVREDYLKLHDQRIREQYGLGPDDPLPEPRSIDEIRKMGVDIPADQLPRTFGRT